MPWAAAIGAVGGALISADAAGSAADTQAGSARDATNLQRQMYEQGRADLMPWQQAGGASLQELMWEMGLSPGAGGQPSGGGAGLPAFGGGQWGGQAPFHTMGGALTRGDPNNPMMGGPAGATPGPGASPWVGDPSTRGRLLRPFDMASFQADPGFQFREQQGEEAINRAAAARGNFMSPATLKELSTFSQNTASDEFNNAYNRYNQNLSNIYSRLTGLSGSGENAAGRIAGLGAGFGSQAGENIIGAGNAQAAGRIGQAGAINQGIGNYMNYDILSRLLQQQQQPSGTGADAGVYGLTY